MARRSERLGLLLCFLSVRGGEAGGGTAASSFFHPSGTARRKGEEKGNCDNPLENKEFAERSLLQGKLRKNRNLRAFLEG